MRAPRPVLMKPREMKNARTMSQIVTSENPLMESAMPSVPDRAVIAIPTMATAPMGSALTMIPTMVLTKMAKRCSPLTQSAFRLTSASALALASASAFTFASASALALVSASTLALASASALTLASCWALVRGLTGVGAGAVTSAAVGTAGLTAGFAGAVAAGLGAAGWPVKNLFTGTATTVGRPKYRIRPSTTVASAGMGLAPCHPDGPPAGAVPETGSWLMRSLHG